MPNDNDLNPLNNPFNKLNPLFLDARNSHVIAEILKGVPVLGGLIDKSQRQALAPQVLNQPIDEPWGLPQETYIRRW